MGMTRNKSIALSIFEELKSISQISKYLEDNVSKKLNSICKSLINSFTCGYNTSSIAESSNSQLKNILPDRKLSKIEVRLFITESHQQSFNERKYIKGVKPHKLKESNVITIMSKLNVSEAIAEAIAGSWKKAKTLKGMLLCDDYIFNEEYTLKNGEKYSEIFEVHDLICNCNKQLQVGIPCSHIINVLEMNNLSVIDNIKIANRWVLNQQNFIYHHEGSKSFEKITYGITHLSPQEGFVLLRAKGTPLYELASRSQDKFEKAMASLDSLEKELNNESIEQIATDEIGIRAGRGKINRNTKKVNPRQCLICSKPHNTKRCPRRGEVLKFVQEGGSIFGLKHCSICNQIGHNYKNAKLKKHG